MAKGSDCICSGTAFLKQFEVEEREEQEEVQDNEEDLNLEDLVENLEEEITEDLN